MPTLRTVYIIDDDDSMRRSLARLMRSCGYAPVSFGSVNEFLTVPHVAIRACVIADVTMRGHSGVTLPQILRARGERLPVILITASDTEEMRAEAWRRGASAYLRKPVDEQALVDAVEWAFEYTKVQ